MLRRVSEVLASVPNAKAVFDRDLSTTCPNCGTAVILSSLKVAEEKGATLYRCPADDEIVVLVTAPGTVPVKDSGMRIGDYVIRNRSDMHLRFPDNPNAVLFPAMGNALHDWTE